MGDQNDSDGFLKKVLDEVEDKLGEHLNQESLIKIKELIRRPFLEGLEAQGVREVMEGMARFAKGAPQEEFRKIASGEKRHKLYAFARGRALSTNVRSSELLASRGR